MAPTSPQTALANAILSLKPSQEMIISRVQQISQDLLARSAHIRQPNFKSIHIRDLEFLFTAYDEQFLNGL